MEEKSCQRGQFREERLTQERTPHFESTHTHTHLLIEVLLEGDGELPQPIDMDGQVFLCWARQGVVFGSFWKGYLHDKELDELIARAEAPSRNSAGTQRIRH